MRFKRALCFLLLLPFLLISSGASAQTVDIIIDDGELFLPDDLDQRLIRDWLEEKRDEPLSDKPNLRISGDVRVRYRWRSEKINGKEVTRRCRHKRNASGDRIETVFPGTNFSDDRDRVEANLAFDYVSECAWAAIKLEFENELGRVSGTANKLALERALIGFNLYECGNTRWWVEAGRQFLLHQFRSEVQYGSRLDGIFTRYETCLPRVGPLYAQGAGMVLDYRCDEYAWIGAIGLEDLYCSKWYIIYSYVDWGSHRSDDKFPFVGKQDESSTTVDPVVLNNPVRIRPYRISQLIVGKKLPKAICCKDLDVAGGLIYNHAAQRIPITDFKRENVGFWLKAQLGKVRKARDWAFIIEYDYVEAQAILESDNSGIGRGNAAKTSIFEGLAAGTARGDTNYRGPSFEAAYAVTDSLTFRMTLVYSQSINNDIGGDVKFKQWEIQAIYAF